MWSNSYCYYNLYDYNFSTEYDYEIIIQTILEHNCFEQKSQNLFGNKNEFPWISIGIGYTRDGNYIIDNIKVDKINILPVVTLKKIDQSKYINYMLKISKKLNWKLFLEEDDEGNEDVEINKT
jgi:hypothetical protein